MAYGASGRRRGRAPPTTRGQPPGPAPWTWPSRTGRARGWRPRRQTARQTPTRRTRRTACPPRRPPPWPAGSCPCRGGRPARGGGERAARLRSSLPAARRAPPARACPTKSPPRAGIPPARCLFRSLCLPCFAGVLGPPSPSTPPPPLAQEPLPKPLGRTSRQPFGILAPRAVYLSGFFRKSTTSTSSSLAPSQPYWVSHWQADVEV